MLSRKVAAQLKELETPFYLYDINLLRQTLESVVYESNKYNYKVHYAIKANNDDYLLSIIREYGLGIDCASGNEVRKAIESGFAPETIVYAGVGKRDKEIRYAIEQGILAINCESIEELQVINQIAGEMGRRPSIGLRINPDIDPKTNRCIDTGQADSKFGISYEEIIENIDTIKALENIDIIGIHIHIGSQIRELHVFENMCNKANAIVEKLESLLGFQFRIVDVGGGLGINYDVPENEPIPNFASLFAIVHEYLNVGEREVHFEFGRSIVGECGELIASVLFNKTTATGRRLLIIDASMTELIRPMLYGSYHNIENITSQEENFKKYTVVGTACESTDVFDENISLRKSKRGDLLAIKSAGAYGRSMASEYNMHELPRAVYSDQLSNK
ncbi:MAG: diaminopimelate decarboxylase [Rikenellaceae bacterium]|nr:diaminopimelate decarboxylase [Rikenellaceae bacterium]